MADAIRVLCPLRRCVSEIFTSHRQCECAVLIFCLCSISLRTASLIKMEDEEGEQFTNTYLNDLLSGGPPSSAATSTAGRPSTAAGDFMPSEDFFAGGRDSVPLSELKMRNSMLPRHLRSSYAVQYNDAYSTEDDIKVSYRKTPPKTPMGPPPMERTFTVHRSSPDMREAAAATVAARRQFFRERR